MFRCTRALGVFTRKLSTGCPVSAHRAAPTFAPIASTKPFLDIPSPPSQGPLGTYGDFEARMKAAPNMLEAFATYYREFGPIVRQNFAGQEEVWCFDPAEMLKVLPKQGRVPWTVAVEVNVLKEWQEKHKRPPVLQGRTESWKQHRTMLQKDIFNPPDAASYAPSLDPAVRAISKATPKFDRLSDMTSLAAMDMFCSIMLGYLPNCTAGEAGDVKYNPADKEFVRSAVRAMDTLTSFTRDPVARQNVTADPRYPAFEADLDNVFAASLRLIQEMSKAKKQINGVKPYFERLLERGEMDETLATEAVQLFLFAGVDTTHHVLMWTILHLATNPHVQEKLYEEVHRVLGDGPLGVEHLTKLPYMTLLLRETHRVTPPAPGVLMRRLEEDVDLCGYLLPANMRVTMMSHAMQNDPKFVENPEVFRPERWSDAEVESRKGTPKQVIDHQLLAKPFGFGARMCIGARVAELEIKALLSRLVRDWKISLKEPNEKWHMALGAMLKAEPYPRMNFVARK